MINPAVNLYNSVNRLDEMVADNMAEDREGVTQFIDQLFDQVVSLYNSSDQVDFADPAFLYRAYAVLEPPERELELLIGLAFRLTSNDMAFTSDVMTNCRLRRAQERAADRDDLADRRDARGSAAELRQLLRRALRAVRAKARAWGHPRRARSRAPACYPIEGYLRRDPRVVMLGTQDDVILSRDEVLWLEDVFGERARIFPTGGHCGSMDQREFVREMLRLIFDAEARS